MLSMQICGLLREIVNDCLPSGANVVSELLVEILVLYLECLLISNDSMNVAFWTDFV